MTGWAKPEFGLRIVYREQRTTEMGSVNRTELYFNGKPRTVYTVENLADGGFENAVKEVFITEKYKNNPEYLKLLATSGTTPDEIIETGSKQFIEDAKDNIFTPDIQTHILSPLIKQRALEIVYKQSKKSTGK